MMDQQQQLRPTQMDVDTPPAFDSSTGFETVRLEDVAPPPRRFYRTIWRGLALRAVEFYAAATVAKPTPIMMNTTEDQ